MIGRPAPASTSAVAESGTKQLRIPASHSPRLRTSSSATAALTAARSAGAATTSQ